MGIGPNPFRVTLKGFRVTPKGKGVRAEWAPAHTTPLRSMIRRGGDIKGIGPNPFINGG